MPASAGIADVVGGGDLLAALGIGGDVAAETGALSAADLGILGAPAVADIGAGAAGDVLGAGALGAGSLFADPAVAGAAEGLTTAADAIPAVGAGFDALGAIGGDALGGTGLTGSTLGADVAATTPGATSLGGGFTGALGGATGAPVSAIGALENPEDLLAVSSGSPVGGADLTGVGATDAARAGLAENLPVDINVGATPPGGGGGIDITNPQELGGASLVPTQSPFSLPAPGSSVAGGGGPAAIGDVGGGGGAAAAGGPADIMPGPSGPLEFGGPGTSAWDASLGLTPQGTVPGGGGDLFGTGITGSQAALYGLAAAPLATALFKGEPGVPQQTQQSTAVSGPEQQYATSMIQSGGAPNQYQWAQINQNTQNAVNAVRQQLFNAGVTNPESDSRWPYFMQMIAQQQNQQIAQFQQQNMSDAFAAAGGAQSALANAGNVQAQQDAAYTQALQNAMKSAGTVLALGGAFGSKPNVNVGPQFSLG
jgi:hypothetical protein